MTNKEFYDYCRIGREAADTIAKRNALQAVYDYMRECGVDKTGVQKYVHRMIAESAGRDLEIEAYQWLLSVFEGPSLKSKEVPEQLSLF